MYIISWVINFIQYKKNIFFCNILSRRNKKTISSKNICVQFPGCGHEIAQHIPDDWAGAIHCIYRSPFRQYRAVPPARERERQFPRRVSIYSDIALRKRSCRYIWNIGPRASRVPRRANVACVRYFSLTKKKSYGVCLRSIGQKLTEFYIPEQI